jgi:hypothetical protein
MFSHGAPLVLMSPTASVPIIQAALYSRVTDCGLSSALLATLPIPKL